MAFPWLGSPAISVVIPTFNRPNELHMCLTGLAHQTVPREQFEVIIVDDGSIEDNRSVIAGFAQTLNLQFNPTPHAGPGAARNIGIELARAPLLALYDDDQRPLPDLIEYCLDFHRRCPSEQDMSLLYFGIDPEIPDSPFVRWAFKRLYTFPAESCMGGWQRFWSGALTCKKSLFRHGQFNPAYQMLEDADLGFRLSRSVDLRVQFEPRLTGTMVRQRTFQQLCNRQYTLGYFSYVFAQEYGDAVSFAHPPYNEPEKYFVRDRAKLAAVVSSARSFELNGSCSPLPTRLLTALWATADMHAKAEGWMAARDGKPPKPPGSIGDLWNV